MAGHDDPFNDDFDAQFDDPFDDVPSDDSLSFDDDELEAALAGFEQEEASKEAARNASDDASAGSGAGEPGDGGADGAADGAQGDATAGFEDELAGLLGNKAKTAAVITRLNSAELLAAFCQLADVSATCLASAQGAVAVLRNLDGDGPEAAARDLTRVVSGLGTILAVNRADKLEATLYVNGTPGEQIPPPILFTSTAPFVEDLLLGISTLDAVERQGVEHADSSDFSDPETAYKVIARYLNGDDGPKRGAGFAG